MKTDKFEAMWGPEGEAVRGYTNRDGTVPDYYQESVDTINSVYAEGKRVIGDLEVGEVFPAAAFIEMSKVEMIEHLVEVHGLDECAHKAMSIGAGTKATKEEMVRAHDAAHAAFENPLSEFKTDHNAMWRRGRGMDDVFTVGGHRVPKMLHSHQAVVLSESAALVRDNKPAGDKPLSAAEAGVLKELVNNDFNGLKQEMSAFASDALTQQIEEINAEWDEKQKSIPDFADQATKIKRAYDTKVRALREKYELALKTASDTYEDEFKAIVNKAQGESVVLTEKTEEYVNEVGAKKTRPIFKATIQGRKEAREAAAVENRKYLDRALMTLEAQRLAAQRRVLVSRVNPQGAKILDGIPDAKAMMVQAQTGFKPMAEIEGSDDQS